MPPPLPDRQGVKARIPPAAPPNYFSSVEVAARYARIRPFFHAEVAERLRGFAGVERFRRVLDVGCGSGQSAIALAAIAGHVTAIDSSQSMLDHAPPRPNIRYQLGLAEQLGLHVEEGVEEFDLVAAGSALHWFDQDRFYAQCRQVLSATGLLAVYNDHFTAHMQDSDACKRWMRTRFAKRFPPPRRGMRDIDEFHAAEFGFTVAHRSSFSHLVPFSREELIAYLMTRSNTLDVLARGKDTHPSVVAWLNRELAPIVPDGSIGSFIFKCNLWVMRKAAAAPRAAGAPDSTILNATRTQLRDRSRRATSTPD